MKKMNKSHRSPSGIITMARRNRMAYGLLLLIFMLHSSAGLRAATRYQISVPNAPVGATTSFCPMGAADVFTNQADFTSCTAGTTNVNRITWEWVYDGTNIIAGATGIFTLTGTPPEVSLTADLAAVLTTLSPGTHTLQCQYTSNRNNCGGTAGDPVMSPTLTFTILPPPDAVTVSGGGAFCVNTVITASGGTGGTIYYQGNTAGGTSTASATTTANITTSGIYYFRAQTASGCWGDEGSVAVTINPLPNAITGTTTVCVNGNTTLSSTTSGGTWTSGSTSIATINSSTGVVTGASAGSAPVTYTVTSTGCSVSTDVSVNPLPADITGTANVCVGTTITLTDADGTGTWSTASSTASVDVSSGVVTGLAVGVANITYTIPSTCFTTSTLNVVLAAPVTGNPNICVGITSTLTDADAGGAWTSSDAAIASINAATGDVTGVATGTATITYTLPSGCYNFLVVTVNTQPGAITGVTSVCQGSTTTLSDPNSGGVWNSSAPATASVDAVTGVVSGISAAPATISYTLSGGCFVTAGVTVDPLPSAISGNDNICVGSSVTLADADAGGVWTSSDATKASVNATGDVAGIATGMATITYTLPTSCFITKAVTVNTQPGAITGSNKICQGLTATLSDPDAGGTWSTSAPSTATVNAAGVVSGVSAATVTISYTLTGNCYVTTEVTVYAMPLVNVTGGGVFCSGGTGIAVGLDNSGVAEINYALYRGATLVTTLNGLNAPLSFGMQTVAGTYSVVATNTLGGCSRNMAGSASISVSAVPTAYNVGGGGAYCEGTGGVDITLSGSDIGSFYQLYNGSVPVGSLVAGSDFPMSLGTQTASGTYMVVANPGAGVGCQATMSGSASVVMNPVPAPFGVTGGGNYCSGGTGVPVGLSFGVAGIQYELFNGPAPVAFATGTGASLSFGSVTSAGTYTVLAQNPATGCTSNMVGSAFVAIDPVPAPFNMNGGGTLCSGSAGVPVGIFPSLASTNYQLYNGATMVGPSLPGTGFGLAFPAQTTSGIYTVLATFPSGCSRASTGTATVVVNPTPTVFSVTGGGTYCSGGTGVTVALNGSTAGVNYQLFNGSTGVGGLVAGTGAALTFGTTFTAAGIYTVSAVNATTICTANMVGTAVVAVNPAPNVSTLTGGGSYCAGGTGVPIGVLTTQTGINYTLYLGVTAVAVVPGNGGSVSFGSNFTTPGIYTVQAVNPVTGCTSTMTGSVSVVVNPLPIAHNMTGGGNYCTGGTGVTVGLNPSTSGVNYTLYNGSTAVGLAVAGTGAPISFGAQTMTATFTVFAVNTGTGCTNTMAGTATVGLNPLPTAFGVTGGGSYCAGNSGVPVGAGSSATGVNYQLYNGSLAVGGPIPGTGAAISFGLMTAAGTYSVQATNAGTGCVNALAGNAVVSINAVPGNLFSVTASGTSYCAGGTGIEIGLSGSESGVTYQLFNGSLASGSLTGTGGALSFGNMIAAGTYTVVATSPASCSSNITTGATIAVNPNPTVFVVTGGGNYCNSVAGAAVGLSNSSSDVSYQLFNTTGPVTGLVSGTGTALSFGLMPAGTYTAAATNTITGCASSMAGAATVNVNLVPAIQSVTGGGVYCAGGAGLPVGIGNSVPGVSYQLYHGSTPTAVVNGNGAPLSFGLQTAVGSYSVMATNASGCTASMAGIATLATNPVPSVYVTGGGGGFCAGGTGVSITLSGSNTSISYQLYNGGMPYGSGMSGSGGALTFNGVTAGGSYNIIATDPVTTCSSNMAGTANVVVNPLPTQFFVTGGGSYCAGGLGVILSCGGSTPGVAYQLYNGTVAVGSMIAGIGLPFDFGYKTAPGNYTVLAINTATSCVNTMLGSPSIVVNPLPLPYNVTGGGGYCNSTSGVAVGLGNSETGVSYQLYLGSGVAGSSIIGSGDVIDFGTFSAPGTYTVLATNTSTSCTNAMSGNAIVSVNSLPTVFNVTGGGTICNGSAGVNINLNNSTSGVSYQLMNAGSPVGSPVSGTGSGITFGPQTLAGNYSAIATNSTTGCQRSMTGSANVIVNMPPAAQPITGGGAYCAGDDGVAIGLGNSVSGTSYQLYNGATAVGTPVFGSGGTIDFGLQTGAGNYNVVASNSTTGCSSTMTGTATITINALPVTYTLSGGGNFCMGGAGVPVVLGGTNNGISYQLMNGATPVGSSVNGNGAPLNFGMVTTSGTYAVIATNNTTGCSRYMNGNPVVNINSLPLAYMVTGGGSYCSGDAGIPVGLMSSSAGVSYQLYNGGSPVGSPVPGYGDVISFGPQAAEGDYSVIAVNNTTLCSNTMSGIATVNVKSLPSVYAVTGGGTICSGAPGVSIGVANSGAGVSYQLYSGALPVGSTILSTGGPVDFGPVAVAGTYTVLATTDVGCHRNMTGSASVIVNTLPVAQTVTGGGSYCAGGSGIGIGLGTSVTGVSYQLYSGSAAVGSPVAGNGSAISFGLQAGAGVYSVLATNAATGCTNAMTGAATVNVNLLPNAYAVLGTGSSYCEGGTGVHILLSNSDPSVNYQLMNGTTPVGGSFAGYGAAIDFGSVLGAGIYKVVATNLSGCSNNMTGSASVQVNPLPATYAITGGGNYCAGSAGSVVGLLNSATGVSYQLFRNGVSTGASVTGTGAPISFGAQTGVGTYLVVGTASATGCSSNMTGTVAVASNALPAVYTVSGGGTYCNGGTGVTVGLLGSATGISYQLYNGGVAAGSAVTGTGGPVSFGAQTGAGTYSVMATNIATGCMRSMTGSVSVIITALPSNTYAVTGSGNYCTGSTGLEIGLSGSATGVNYQLFNGATPVGAATLAGTGAPLSFGTHNAGNYTIVGTSIITGCSNTMTGAANVVASALPEAVTVTGGGSYCTAASATGLPVGLAGSSTGVSYQLSAGGSVMTTVAGTGSPISFGNQMVAGTYTVLATNTTTGCTNVMGGSATITVNPSVVPAVTVATGIGNTVCLGTLTTFTATPVNGGSTPVYQWQVNGAAVGLGFSTYTYVPANGDVVSVALTSSDACAAPAIATNSIIMTVSSHEMPKAHVTVMPNDTVCAGTLVTYTVTPEFGGAHPTYTWMKGSVQVATGTSYSYIPTDNDVITCKMTSDFPCRLADEVATDVKMTVVTPVTPIVSISANPGFYNAPGRIVTLTANVSNAGANPTYQWSSNSSVIGGATSSSYTSNNFSNDDEISVAVTNNGVCAPATGTTSVVMKVITTGVGSVGSSLKDMTLIPNPNKGDFIVKGNMGTTADQELVAEVTDMLGQVVYRNKIIVHNGVVNEKIQISNTLANGMYLLNLRSETENMVFHFVLEN